MTLRQLTLILPYYENPLMLMHQYNYIASLPLKLRENIHVIIVDDGSSAKPAFPPKIKLGVAKVELYRILVDIRWNWLAARNLAMSKISTEWALLTDIDHLVSPEAFLRIIKSELDRDSVYQFRRVVAPYNIPINPHPNSWFLTQTMFDGVGGYDERFSGLYGTDGEFIKRIKHKAKDVIILAESLIVIKNNLIPDASTTLYSRKQVKDYKGVSRVKKLIQMSPTPHRLTFPWEKVY